MPIRSATFREDDAIDNSRLDDRASYYHRPPRSLASVVEEVLARQVYPPSSDIRRPTQTRSSSNVRGFPVLGRRSRENTQYAYSQPARYLRRADTDVSRNRPRIVVPHESDQRNDEQMEGERRRAPISDPRYDRSSTARDRIRAASAYYQRGQVNSRRRDHDDSGLRYRDEALPYELEYLSRQIGRDHRRAYISPERERERNIEAQNARVRLDSLKAKLRAAVKDGSYRQAADLDYDGVPDIAQKTGWPEMDIRTRNRMFRRHGGSEFRDDETEITERDRNRQFSGRSPERSEVVVRRSNHHRSSSVPATFADREIITVEEDPTSSPSVSDEETSHVPKRSSSVRLLKEEHDAGTEDSGSSGNHDEDGTDKDSMNVETGDRDPVERLVVYDVLEEDPKTVRASERLRHKPRVAFNERIFTKETIGKRTRPRYRYSAHNDAQTYDNENETTRRSADPELFPDAENYYYNRELKVTEPEDFDQFTLPWQQDEHVSKTDKSSAASQIGDDEKKHLLISGANGELPPYALRHVFESRYDGKKDNQRPFINTTAKAIQGLPYLYRWIHLEDSNMQFDEFRKQVEKIDKLTFNESAAITKLLDRVQNNGERTVRNAKTGQNRTLASCCLEEVFVDSSSATEKPNRLRTATWICLPYFSVEPYTNSNNSAMRTLLQIHYGASTRKQSDVRQAVDDLPHLKPKTGFHVTQVWCLVVGHSLLVSCAPVRRNKLLGDRVNLIGSVNDLPKTKLQRIIVSSGEVIKYLLYRDRCQTWFHLLSQFADLWPYSVKLTCQGKVVDSESWPKILESFEDRYNDIPLELELIEPEVLSPRIMLQDSDSEIAINTQESDAKTADVYQLDRDTANVSNSSSLDSPISPKTPINSTINRNEPSLKLKNDTDGKADLNRVPKIQAPDDSGFQKSSDFSAFAWIAIGGEDLNGKPGRINPKERLRQLLAKIDTTIETYLKKRNDLEKCLSYTNSQTSLHSAVRAHLSSQLKARKESQAEGASKKAFLDDELWDIRIGLFNFSEDLFKFFIPLTFEGPTASIYWGAVNELLLPASSLKSRERQYQKGAFDIVYLKIFQTSFEELVRKTEPIRLILSEASAEDRSGIETPISFIHAWRHIVVSLLQYAKCLPTWEHNMSEASQHIEEGIQQIMNSLSTRGNARKAILRPMEVALTLSLHLLNDLPADISDIRTTYWDYLSDLERSIQEDPLDRSHKDKIVPLSQEAGAAVRILTEQQHVIEELSVSIENAVKWHVLESGKNRSEDQLQPENVVETLIQSSEGAHHKILTNTCLAVIQRKMTDLAALSLIAQELDEQTTRHIDSNKSQQEAAIYIFTLVTVIFLPLSTVAGILGMNTNDVRNMEQDQWVFWVVAVPLLAVVIFLCQKLQAFKPVFKPIFKNWPTHVRSISSILPFKISWNKKPTDDAGTETDTDQRQEPKTLVRRTTSRIARRRNMIAASGIEAGVHHQRVPKTSSRSLPINAALRATLY